MSHMHFTHAKLLTLMKIDPSTLGLVVDTIIYGAPQKKRK